MDNLISCHVVNCNKLATNWFVAKLLFFLCLFILSPLMLSLTSLFSLMFLFIFFLTSPTTIFPPLLPATPKSETISRILSHLISHFTQSLQTPSQHSQYLRGACMGNKSKITVSVQDLFWVLVIVEGMGLIYCV